MGPPGWKNPITAPAGSVQSGVDPLALLPGRDDLVQARLDFQRVLLQNNRKRLTPILVTADGVIYDGHHAVRAAAEIGQAVDVKITAQILPPTADSILDLPVS